MTPGLVSTPRLEPIQKELGLEPLGTSTEQKFIHAVTIGHVYILSGQPERTINSLKELSDPQSLKYNYTNAVMLKRRALLAAAYELSGNTKDAIKEYMEVVKLPDNIASKTPESSVWMARIFYRFGNFAKAKSMDQTIQLVALRGFFKTISSIPNNNDTIPLPSAITSRLLNDYLTLAFTVLHQNPNDSNASAELSRISKYYEKIVFASNSGIPHATGSNKTVEDYCSIVMKTWEAGDQDPRDVFAVLQQAAKKTFQSTVIMRFHLIILKSLGRFDEALAAFSTYSAYQNLYLRQAQTSGGDHDSRLTGDSTSGIVESYTIALELYLEHKKDMVKIKETSDELKNILKSFSSHENHDNTKTNTKTNENYKNNNNNNSNDDDNEISISVQSKAYFWLGKAYAFAMSKTHQGESYTSYCADADKYMSWAITLDPKTPIYSLEYGVFLARQRQLSNSLVVVREALIHNPDYFSLWHLLALVLSAQEAYDDSYRVTTNGLARAFQIAGQSLNSFDADTKYSLLQLKMTEIMLIEMIDGADEAVDTLPEAVSFFSRLYPGLIQSDEISDSKEGVKSKKTDALKKIRRKSQEVNVNSKEGMENHHLHTIFKTKVEKEMLEIIQSFWIWISGVYRRADQLTEAEQAIVEAENLNGPTVNTRVELGLLMAKERPLHAQEQFESALDEDNNNLEATLGLARLILEHSKIETFKEFQTGSKPSSDFFVSSKDELAAIFRIRGLLETQVLLSPGRESSEIWWYLSKIFKKVDDYTAMEDALWKSLEFEEARPVRDWACVKTFR